jgi:hypothetical protein
MPDTRLTITAAVNGQPILAATVDGPRIAGLIAKHPQMDDWIATKGWCLDVARDAALENLKSADIAQHVQTLLPALLWLACRGADGETCKEAVRHGGVTLALLFHELPGDRATMQRVLLPPSTH